MFAHLVSLPNHNPHPRAFVCHSRRESAFQTRAAATEGSRLSTHLPHSPPRLQPLAQVRKRIQHKHHSQHHMPVPNISASSRENNVTREIMSRTPQIKS